MIFGVDNYFNLQKKDNETREKAIIESLIFTIKIICFITNFVNIENFK